MVKTGIDEVVIIGDTGGGTVGFRGCTDGPGVSSSSSMVITRGAAGEGGEETGGRQIHLPSASCTNIPWCSGGLSKHGDFGRLVRTA